MRLIIAGTRDFRPFTCVFMEHIMLHFDIEAEEITEVVCGRARGVDASGKNWAESRGIHVETFPADWDKYGKAAGPIRNEEMGDFADALLLIWNGRSPGSSHMKQYMLKLNKPIYEVVFKGVRK